MIDREQFGRRLSVLRKKLSLSQAELAERFGVSTQAVSKWETGLALPDVDILLEMSWLFDISVNSLLEGGDQFINSPAMTRARIPEKVDEILKAKNEKQLFSALEPYFTEVELYDLAKRMMSGTLKINLDVEVDDSKAEFEKNIAVPVKNLSESSLRELAPVISEAASELVGGIDRGLKRISEFMICPACKERLVLNSEDNGRTVYFTCKNGHRYNVDDGVVYFGTREIPGELWSLYLRNYKQYLIEQNWPEQSPEARMYDRGNVFSEEVKWREIEKRRPRYIIDIATGNGGGVKYLIQRINWNCTLILCDLSHRILKWDRKYFSENLHNPYMDMVYFACDCANLPLFDDSIDCVISCCGFESMQEKMMDGFKEAYRILKPGSCAVYGMSAVDGHDSANTQKWVELMHTVQDGIPDTAIFDKMIDICEWKQKCSDTGFSSTEAIKIYGEMDAPDTDIFPFENMIIRWMAEYICVSRK